jgi:hypothetical protein
VFSGTKIPPEHFHPQCGWTEDEPGAWSDITTTFDAQPFLLHKFLDIRAEVLVEKFSE